MKTIVTVVGARPQFVKASVVSRALARRGGFREHLVHTGQHFDANMSGVFFDELEMKAPDENLAINRGSHADMTARMLVALEEIILRERPDGVLVYGDTTSTLAGALAASKLHVPAAHVEAGLRSFNRRMPEEINRIVADHVSTWLFTPTDGATARLQQEGLDPKSVFQVGDVMYDVALEQAARVERLGGGALATLGRSAFALVTIHRAENADVPDRLRAIVGALRLVARNMPVVWPVHPRTRASLESLGLWDEARAAIEMIDPQGYLDMVRLERAAAVVVTDSGGVQREAYFHGVPCVTVRDETEWSELLSLGWNRLAPPSDPESVAAAVLAAVGSRGTDGQPYGDGNAASRVADILSSVL